MSRRTAGSGKQSRRTAVPQATESPICALCGHPIIDARYFLDYWGNSYHEGHRHSHPACDYCGRLIAPRSTGGGTTHEDGRHICALCRKRAVESRRRGIEVLYEARDRMERHGIVIRPFHPTFKLLQRETLHAHSQSGKEQGLTHVSRRIAADGSVQQLAISVFVLKGLPYEDFLAASAHELMHVWLQLNGRRDAKRPFIEGSCNMAAYLLLRELRTREGEYRISRMQADKDRIYGRGFLGVLHYYRRRGKAAWLEAARTRRSLPLW